MLYRNSILALGWIFSLACYGLDTGSESMADKADRFDFEEFHKEKGITLWEEKKGNEKKGDEKKAKPGVDVKPGSEASVPATGTAKTFEKGEELNLREAYKLGNDPALRSVQGLYDAIEALHKQLNGYCPNGWVKEQEWHKPEAGYFYIYYRAVCL